MFYHLYDTYKIALDSWVDEDTFTQGFGFVLIFTTKRQIWILP